MGGREPLILPAVSFWDRPTHNAMIVWPPGFRRFNYTGRLEVEIEKLRMSAPVRYDGPIVPFHVTLGFTGLRRQVVQHLLERRGHRIVDKPPPMPQVRWRPRRIINGEWVTQ